MISQQTRGALPSKMVRTNKRQGQKKADLHYPISDLKKQNVPGGFDPWRVNACYRKEPLPLHKRTTGGYPTEIHCIVVGRFSKKLLVKSIQGGTPKPLTTLETKQLYEKSIKDPVATPKA